MPAPSTSESRRLVFTASDEGGFGAYHDLYAGVSTVSRLGPTFGATLVAHRFPGLMLFDRQIAGAVHHRDETRLRRDGMDHFNLQVLRSGRMTAGAAGEERAMAPGDVAVFDTSRPQRTVVERADYVALSLPRDVVETVLPGARGLHGAVLPRVAAGLLGDFMLSLARHASTLSAELAARGGETVVDLLVTAIGAAGPRRSEDAALASLRGRAEAYIDAHLHDPTLDVDRIAAALGLSRSALYRAFAPVDGVTRRITAKRLDRLRAALGRPGEHRSIAALAFESGFSTQSHCGRAFKAAFGVTPGQFRAESRGVRGLRDGEARPCGLGPWIGEHR